MLENLLLSFPALHWRDLLDISLVAFVLYRVILLVRGTRAVSVIFGLLLVLLVYYLSGEFGLYTLHWLLANFLGSIFLVVIILFQQDIRKALAEMGTAGLWRRRNTPPQILDELVLAVMEMAQRRIGALVVIERQQPLGDVIARGVLLNAVFSRDLLLTIFRPETPLHDGAVVIRGKTIRAAACILPLAAGVEHKSDWGTRHRAAMGITEESDAVAIIVSEERGSVTAAIGGKLTTALDEVRLKRVLLSTLKRQ
ncbi:MAG: diadenylate cyclase CdaA [Thermodesulfobacteriota bacterium]